MLFALNLVIFNSYPGLNLTVFVGISTITIIYLVKIKPHKSNIHLIRDIVTESMFLVMFLASFPLLSENVSENTQKNIAIAIIGSIITILAMEFLSLFSDYVKMVFKIW